MADFGKTKLVVLSIVGIFTGNWYHRNQDNLLQKLTESQGQSSRQIFVHKMQEAEAVRDDIDASVVNAGVFEQIFQSIQDCRCLYRSSHSTLRPGILNYLIPDKFDLAVSRQPAIVALMEMCF